MRNTRQALLILAVATNILAVAYYLELLRIYLRIVNQQMALTVLILQVAAPVLALAAIFRRRT